MATRVGRAAVQWHLEAASVSWESIAYPVEEGVAVQVPWRDEVCQIGLRALAHRRRESGHRTWGGR